MAAATTGGKPPRFGGAYRAAEVLSPVEVTAQLMKEFGGYVEARNATVPHPPAAVTDTYRQNSATLSIMMYTDRMTRETITDSALNAFTSLTVNFATYGASLKHAFSYKSIAASDTWIQVTFSLTVGAQY